MTYNDAIRILEEKQLDTGDIYEQRALGIAIKCMKNDKHHNNDLVIPFYRDYFKPTRIVTTYKELRDFVNSLANDFENKHTEITIDIEDIPIRVKDMDNLKYE